MNENLDINEIIELIKENDINRNKYLLKFLRLLNNNGNNKIFSLNGSWGSGKTVFIKKLNCLINYCYLFNGDNEVLWDNIYSEYNNFTDENKKQLKEIINRKEYSDINSIIKSNNLNSVYINAWEHDDESDPIVSIIYELTKMYKLENYSKELNISLKSISKMIFSLKTGGILNYDNIIEESDIYSHIYIKDEIKEKISMIMDNLICENCNKLVIFIDELDRCNPFYAVKLLERIKHYFNDERIVIVLSTNIRELANTISAVYGHQFSSEEYLDKIIDMRLELPKINYKDYIKTKDSIINYDSNAWLSIVESEFMNYKKLDMRPINRYLGCMKFFEKNIISRDLYYYEGLNALINFLFIPYAVGLFSINVKDYENFKSGNGWNDFKKFVESSNNIVSLCFSSLYDNNKDIAKTDMLEELKKLYDNMFISNNSYCNIQIGDNSIYGRSLNSIEDKMSLLGDLSDFS